MGKVKKITKRVGLAVGTGGLSEMYTAAQHLRKGDIGGAVKSGAFGDVVTDAFGNQKPAKPGALPVDTTEKDLAAARAAELDERKKKRISLITSPGGAFLSAKDLSKPRLLGQ